MRTTLLTLFNKTQVESVPVGREYLVLAKAVTTDSMTQYLLKVLGNRLINPVDYTIYELKKNDGQLVRVSEEVYNKYHAIINGQSKTPLRTLEGML
jgi:hypothetical protein